jgi:hypothetical protein
METSFNIVDCERFGKKLATINRKLAKKGLAQVEVLSSEREIVKVYDDYEKRFRSIPTLKMTLEVSTPVLGVEGTVTMIGTVEDTSAGNFISSMHVSYEEMMQQFRASTLRCDHCGKNKARKSCIAFLHNDKLLLIGRSCAAEYFGLDIAGSLSQMILSETNAMSERYGRTITSHTRFMAACLFMVRRFGFKPAASDDSTKGGAWIIMATDPRVLRDMTPKNKEMRLEFLDKEEDKMLEAELLYTYFQNLEVAETDGFLQNVKIAVLDVNKSRWGLLAYAVKVYFEATEAPLMAVHAANQDAEVRARIEAEQARKANSVWYGEIGGKVEVEVTFRDERVIGTDFGEVSILKFEAPEGSTITWFTGTSLRGYDLEVGKRFKIRGTVKKQDEYKEVRNTVLTRCKLEAA